MKMKRIIGSAAAATLALSAVSSYVAFADPGASRAAVAISSAAVGSRPTLSDAAEAEIATLGTIEVSYTDSKVVVNFATKTKAEVEAAVAASDLMKKGAGPAGGIDPVYMTITVGTSLAQSAAADAWTGYGWDDSDHKDFNVNGTKIMLWMPAVLTSANDEKTITYNDGTNTVTIPIKYTYKAETVAATPVAISNATVGTRPTLSSAAEDEIATLGAYTVSYANSKVVVEFTEKTKAEVEAAVAASDLMKKGAGPAGGIDPVYMTITVGASLTQSAAADAWSGYGWDDPEHKDFNVNGTKIMLWLKAVGTTKTITYTDGTSTVTIPIEYKYKTASSNTSEPTTSGTTETTTSAGTVLVPTTPVEPSTTSGSTTSGSTTSDSTSSAAATVEEVKGEVTADVKVGETVTVKSDDLGGDVTVATDKEDKALEGTKLELEVTNDKTETTKELNEAVGTNASTEVKATVEAAVKAVEAGNAVTLDISFTKDGKTVQPGKDVTVTVPVPSVVKGADKLFIYHVTDKGLEDITSKCKYDKDKGTVAITNDKFSPYIISKVEIKADSAATSGSSSTTSNGGSTSNPNTGVALAMTPIILAGAAVAVISVKKRS